MLSYKKYLFYFFICMTFLYGEKNSLQTEIKYFLGTTGIYGGIEANVPIFSIELDKNLYPLQDTSFLSYMNGLTTIIYPDSFSKKGGELEIPLESFYKVSYENNIQRKAELIKLSGYTYVNGILHIDKNATKINQGVSYKFDNKGRGIYRYSFETDESCRTFYAIQYEERICTSNKEVSPVKNYYENNQLRITISYRNGILLSYSTSSAACDREGKRINHSLDHMLELYKKHVDTFSNKKKKFFQNMIKEEKEKIKNTPDLNLTLEKQYIDRIDKLNGR